MRNHDPQASQREVPWPWEAMSSQTLLGEFPSSILDPAMSPSCRHPLLLWAGLAAQEGKAPTAGDHEDQASHQALDLSAIGIRHDPD